jgi:hypothetical protein
MWRSALIVATVAIASLLSGAVAQQAPTLSTEAARGKYVLQIAGCNDCHTPGYTASGGKVEERLWLTGDQLGWRGPWGTTYASNLPPPREGHVGGPVREICAQRVPPADAVVQSSRDDRPRCQGDLRLHKASRPSGPASAAIHPGRQDASRTFCAVPRTAQVSAFEIGQLAQVTTASWSTSTEAIPCTLTSPRCSQ